MISLKKSKPAILAVQTIIASARFLASDGNSHHNIVEILDVADHLTGLIWRDDDCTLLFEEVLRDSLELFGMRSALTLFLDESV